MRPPRPRRLHPAPQYRLDPMWRNNCDPATAAGPVGHPIAAAARRLAGLPAWTARSGSARAKGPATTVAESRTDAAEAASAQVDPRRSGIGRCHRSDCRREMSVVGGKDTNNGNSGRPSSGSQSNIASANDAGRHESLYGVLAVTWSYQIRICDCKGKLVDRPAVSQNATLLFRRYWPSRSGSARRWLDDKLVSGDLPDWRDNHQGSRDSSARHGGNGRGAHGSVVMMNVLAKPKGWRSQTLAATVALMCLTMIPTAAAAPAVVPRSRDMILPLAQVQSIVGSRGPTLDADPYEDRTSPWVDHSLDARLSAPCRHFANEDEAFGSAWVNFASAGYSGSSNIGVSQRIAVYPDVDTARRTFEALKTAARQCHAHPSPDALDAADILTEPDAATLLIQYPNTVNGPGSVGIDALRGQVLIEVGAPHFSTDPRIAQTVLTSIVAKIT